MEVFLAQPYLITTFIFMTLFFFTECGSAAKKGASHSNYSTVSQNIDVIKKYPVAGNSGVTKTSILKKPRDLKIGKSQVIVFQNDDIKATLYAKIFGQGNAVYCEIENKVKGSDPADVSVYYNKVNVPVTKTSWGYRCLWGINPEEKPGYVPVTVHYSINGGKNSLASEIKIRDIKYPVSKTMLDVGKFSNKDYYSDPKFRNLIAECAALRKKAFSIISDDKIESTISHPRNFHKITGDYWRKRIYLNYKIKNNKRVKVKGRRSFHRGLDFKGDIGAPVYAMADGVVVLSHSMFWEGKMVVIDHGNQVFSYYQHMDSLKVNEGQKVRAGDIIGGVGATGMVTGPHLHIAFSIRGVHVNPLSILYLPVSR